MSRKRVYREITYLAPLPNEGSPHETPASIAIDVHYSNLLLYERWTYDRFVRLCAFLRVTEYEMASLVMMPHAWVPRFERDNRVPGAKQGAGRALLLILTILEAKLLHDYTRDVIDNPFPRLDKFP